MKKFTKNCLISQKFGILRQVWDKLGTQLHVSFILSERHFNKLFYLYHEQILFWFLIYGILELVIS